MKNDLFNEAFSSNKDSNLEENELDNNRKEEIFIEKYFTQDIYISIIDFLLNRVLILNSALLYNIRHNQENYFNEK